MSADETRPAVAAGPHAFTDLGPLAVLSGLTSIWLGSNRIRDVTPLAGLTGLTFPGLRDNQISDISPRSGLTRVIDLDITYNSIPDLSALRRMRELRLPNNPITDIGALEGLTELHELHIHDLPTSGRCGTTRGSGVATRCLSSTRRSAATMWRRGAQAGCRWAPPAWFRRS
jgi:hypothetical protein